eukprot:TRINITY_DN54_c0_g1_i1.p1 TRINITY_DN54_c0_g1~~TRINITY_DN54_c0_g1_i1.p1  ORF type:complete len:386 (-),score=78.68 TRINITY_DN54_c0_g1_i1:137-1270(-)
MRLLLCLCLAIAAVAVPREYAAARERDSRAHRVLRKHPEEGGEALYGQGSVITAQFKCLDLFCPHWELDISALNHVTAIPDVLLTLVPKSPAANMNFPVFTAFDPATRQFTVLGLAASDDVRLWTVTVASDSKGVTPLVNASVTALPTNYGSPVAMHYARIAGLTRLYVVLSEGFLAELDIHTGAVGQPVAVLPGVSQASARAVGATALDAARGVLQVSLRSKTSLQYTLVAFDLAAGKPRSNVSVSVPHDTLELEDAFNAVWDNTTQSLYWLVTGKFDQILSIDPTTGAGKTSFNNLAEDNWWWYTDSEAHADDTLHVQTLDPATNRLYLQITYHEPDQDYITSFAYWDLGAKFIYEIYNPITFGLSGFQWVPFAN